MKELPRQPRSEKWLLANLLMIVCALVLAVHLPALSARALSFDDQQYLTSNVLVQNPSWASTQRFLTEVLEPSTVTGYYQPLAMTSLMLDCALGGRPDNLFPFHRTSLLLHVANTALVIVLLYLLFGQPWVVAAVGLLFGAHPMTVETIAWVSERKTLLAAFFALSSLILYVRFARNRDWKCYVGCSVMYVLAVMSKPTSIPLPMLMLLMDYWPLKRLKLQTAFEKLSLFVVGTIFAAITYISQSRAANVLLPGQYDPWRIPLFLCHNIIFYLHKIVWPVNLSSHYAVPEPLGLANAMILTGLIGSCVLIPLLVLSLRWTRAVFAGWLIFFVAILPTMQIIGFSNVIASDKFAYLPSVGLLFVLASFLGWFCATATVFNPARRRVAVTIVVLVVACLEAVGTRRYLVHWRETVSLYRHMLTLTPDVAPIHNNLANALQEQDKLDEAIYHYHQALQINPHYALAHNNLANALKSHAKIEEAIWHYQRAIQDKPHFAKAHSNLGMALAMTSPIDQALPHLRQAVRLNPHSPMFLTRLAWILATHPDPNVRDVTMAGRLAEQAAQLTKYQSPRVLDTLAAAYAEAGRFGRAVTTAQRALDLVADSNDGELTDQIYKRLELYRQAKPYRENPTPGKTAQVARMQLPMRPLIKYSSIKKGAKHVNRKKTSQSHLWKKMHIGPEYFVCFCAVRRICI